MRELRLNQEDLARALGVGRAAVGHYLRGRRRITSSQSQQLCRTLNVSMSWLFEGREDDVEEGPEVGRPVPELDWVSAGRPEAVQACGLTDAIAYHPSPFPGRPHLFALRIRGASMEPRFKEGDLIYIDPDEPAAHGKFVVVTLEDRNEALFKQLLIEGGRRYLRALNPSWPEQIVEIDGNATICGVAVFKGEVL